MPWVSDKIHILTEKELEKVLNDPVLREKIERMADLLKKLMELEGFTSRAKSN